MLLLVLGLVVSPCSAVEYCKDFLEPGNFGGLSTSLKTFDDEWTMEVGDEVEFDIWINDVSHSLLTAGFWIEYDPSVVSIVGVDVYDNYDSPPGPWEVAFTTIVPDAGGTGTYMVNVGATLIPVSPDGDGDIIIGKVLFRCEGDATITISTIPGLDTIVGDTTVFDSEIIPNTITVHQIIADSDADDIPDYEDNCPNVPNGSNLGTCVKSNFFSNWIICINSDCLSNDNCEIDETCQKNQEDRDGDGLGDVCDNCPNQPNPNQEDNYPSQGNGIGDDCDCEGDFDCDTDIDGSDAAAFKADFGRSPFNRPCTNGDSCKGDFDCDTDVDGIDAGQFKKDFTRSAGVVCPCCEVIDWCTY